MDKNLLMIVNRKKNQHHFLASDAISGEQLMSNNQSFPEELKHVYFICKMCVQHLRKNMLPPKSVSNALGSVFVPEEASLKSYLEEALIARVLLFIKIFSLRTSLMPAMKDKCVVIPLDSKDISDTIEKLPRIPSQSGIIDIHWKRQINQRNSHLQAKVCPARIFNALKFLRESGNQYYQDIKSQEEYENQCMVEDPTGFSVIFGDKTGDGLSLIVVDDTAAEPIVELREYLMMKKQSDDEQQLINDDRIRKFQINYNNDVYMVEKYPEGMSRDDVQLPSNPQDCASNALETPGN